MQKANQGRKEKPFPSPRLTHATKGAAKVAWLRAVTVSRPLTLISNVTSIFGAGAHLPFGTRSSQKGGLRGTTRTQRCPLDGAQVTQQMVMSNCILSPHWVEFSRSNDFPGDSLFGGGQTSFTNPGGGVPCAGDQGNFALKRAIIRPRRLRWGCAITLPLQNLTPRGGAKLPYHPVSHIAPPPVGPGGGGG